jgi:uncharacterized protein (TIGR02118 family)
LHQNTHLEAAHPQGAVQIPKPRRESKDSTVRYYPQMVIVTVLYPKTEQSHFNFDYYLSKHIPMVKDRFGEFGLEDVRLLRGARKLDATTPDFEVIAELAFPSGRHVEDALTSHGNEIIGDIPAFTNVTPTIQLNEQL